jgi:hypothetical protein
LQEAAAAEAAEEAEEPEEAEEAEEAEDAEEAEEEAEEAKEEAEAPGVNREQRRQGLVVLRLYELDALEVAWKRGQLGA